MTRGEGEGEKEGESLSGNMYKDLWTKTMGGGEGLKMKGRGVGRAGESNGEKMGTTVIEQQ